MSEQNPCTQEKHRANYKDKVLFGLHKINMTIVGNVIFFFFKSSDKVSALVVMVC